MGLSRVCSCIVGKVGDELGGLGTVDVPDVGYWLVQCEENDISSAPVAGGWCVVAGFDVGWFVGSWYGGLDELITGDSERWKWTDTDPVQVEFRL
jgi:hypothetical protein